jgi:hypothetical protein
MGGRLLETIGTVMIAAAVLVLLILISLAYQPKGAERRPAVAETIIAGVAALLAIGLGLAEVGTSPPRAGPTGRSRSAGSAWPAARWC